MDHYTRGNRTPTGWSSDIPPDYGDDSRAPSAGRTRESHLDGQRHWSSAGHLASNVHPYPTDELGNPRHRSLDDVNSRDRLVTNMNDRERGPHGEGYGGGSPGLTYRGGSGHGRHGSGGYDNQVFTQEHEIIDDYERGRYRTDRETYPSDDQGRQIYTENNNGYLGQYGQQNLSRSQGEFDAESVFTVDFGEISNKHNVWDKLHTIRLRRKSQKSRRSRRSVSRHRHDSDSADEDIENEGLLPSLQIRHKPKTLHERLIASAQTTRNQAEVLRDNQRHEAGGVDSVKHSIKQGWQRKRYQVKGWLYQLELWAATFKEIEGRFGMATVSYFRFTRWLLFLNLYIFLIMFFIVVVPQLAIPDPEAYQNSLLPNTSFSGEAIDCTIQYAEFNQATVKNENASDQILAFIQGTGWMERTHLFYGVYYNRTIKLPGGSTSTYNMSQAYLLATAACFLISFVLIVKNSGKTVKEAVVDRQSTKTLYCNKVFCGWDFCITNEKAAKNKLKSYYREIKDDLKEQNRLLQQQGRSTKEKCRLIMIRLLINLFVLAVLCASLYLIYYTTQLLIEFQKQDLSEVVTLLAQYLPSLTITILNFLVPLIFIKVVILEDYGPAVELNITLIRTVLLRLASLGVLVISLYVQLVREEGSEGVTCGNAQWKKNNNTAGNIKCWETYVGQQFYKLALLDFVSVVLLTFFVEIPRKLVVEKLQEKLKIIKLVGHQEFDLPKNVLDIVYSQTLCWLGMFFCPLIPAITLMKVLIIFYVKKLSVLYNCVPNERPYRASRSNSFFMTVLLFSFILSVIPLGYLIGKIHPSKSCGPFRLYSSSEHVMFDTITYTVSSWPEPATSIFLYLGTVGFFVPAIILLCLLMYYYWAASQGYKKMEQLLKEQLKMEGQDRQFLLARVNDVIQRGELGQVVTG